MKITRDIFTKATAEAMKLDSTKKLFKNEPDTFDLFSLFSWALLKEIDGKDITEDEFCEALAEVVAVTNPDTSHIAVLLDMAFMVFGAQIWSELKKLDKPERESSESEKFKFELKSRITT